MSLVCVWGFYSPVASIILEYCALGLTRGDAQSRTLTRSLIASPPTPDALTIMTSHSYSKLVLYCTIPGTVSTYTTV